MSLSKIISVDNPKQADIKPLDFHDLNRPLPERSRAGKAFQAADFFRETGPASPEERFVASFGREAAKFRLAAEEALAVEQDRAELEAQREEPPPPPTPEELLNQARAEAEAIRAEAGRAGPSGRLRARPGRGQGTDRPSGDRAARGGGRDNIIPGRRLPGSQGRRDRTGHRRDQGDGGPEPGP